MIEGLDNKTRRNYFAERKKENSNHESANRSNKSLRVIRATPITPNQRIDRRSNKRLRRSVIGKNKINGMESKENVNNMNSKKYEYGNPAVLAWMQTKKKQRAEKIKLIEMKKQSDIQKRKDYISNLNKRQKERAQKVIKKQREYKAMLSPKNDEIILDNKVIIDNDSNGMHPANILLSKLQNEDLVHSPESKSAEAHCSDVVSNHSLSESVLSQASSSKSLLDKKGNVDPMLLLKIYDCIQQNKSMRNSTTKVEKSSPSSNCRSKKIKIAKKKPYKRIKSQIIVRKKQNKDQNNFVKKKQNVKKPKNKKMSKPKKTASKKVIDDK